VTSPHGWLLPLPVANAAPSSLARLSAIKVETCWSRCVSARTSSDPVIHAASFAGVTTSAPMLGVASDTGAASAAHTAVTPAEVTPFQVLLVPMTVRASRRCGAATPALVRMIVSSNCKGRANAPVAPDDSAKLARTASFCRTRAHAARSSSLQAM